MHCTMGIGDLSFLRQLLGEPAEIRARPLVAVKYDFDNGFLWIVPNRSERQNLTLGTILCGLL